MHKAIVLAALAAGAAVALFATPSAAAPRLVNPSDAGTLVTRVADVDRPAARAARHARVYHGGGREYWHYRLQAGRWLHDQYVSAGYPASRYEGEVYYTTFPGDYCCGYRRHWPWMGRYHYGPRYWGWMGRRHHHHYW